MQQQQTLPYWMSWIIDILVVIQLGVGSAATSLAPTADQHLTAVTILSALNTTLSGLVAMLRGRHYLPAQKTKRETPEPAATAAEAPGGLPGPLSVQEA